MNIEAYDLDSLRKIVRTLQKENEALKSQLKKADIAFDAPNPFDETIENNNEYDPDQGERILGRYITEDLAKRYFAMFWGRQDVYAKRGKNGGYFPQCDNRWNDGLCPKQRGEKMFCDDCEHTKWTKLDLKKIVSHLVGKNEDGMDVLGVYPLLENGTCRFIVFDFDNHEKDAEKTDFANKDDEWHDEVDALRKMCEMNGIKSLVERSRSGRGAHVWIFFKRPIAASLARSFGFLLLDKGSASINMKSFHYYDRMYPSQDVASCIGNLIALPLQGQALKRGNSAFVDENWNAYPDQWKVLLEETEKLSLEDIEKYMTKWKVELAEARGMLANSVTENRPKPWRKKEGFAEQDLVEAEKKIIISSPEITHDKIERLIYLLKSRQEAGVSVVVITTEPDNVSYGSPDVCNELIVQLKLAGVLVKLKEEVEEHFSVIDDELVWHGGMNLLGKEDAWDNLMRIKSHQVASELLEIAWEKIQENMIMDFR